MQNRWQFVVLLFFEVTDYKQKLNKNSSVETTLSLLLDSKESKPLFGAKMAQIKAVFL